MNRHRLTGHLPTDVTIAIPVRLESLRFPCKALAKIGGQPLLWHLWHTLDVEYGTQRLVILSDSDEVITLATRWGRRTLRTPAWPRNGIERIASVLNTLSCGVVVNVQADQIVHHAGVIAEAVSCWRRTRSQVVTPIHAIGSHEEALCQNLVKVAVGSDGTALYFSRLPIPYIDRSAAGRSWWGHVGIYLYERAALRAYLERGPCDLERAEDLEQLRFLDMGIRIQTFEIKTPPRKIDKPGDLHSIVADWRPA